MKISTAGSVHRYDISMIAYHIWKCQNLYYVTTNRNVIYVDLHSCASIKCIKFARFVMKLWPYLQIDKYFSLSVFLKVIIPGTPEKPLMLHTGPGVGDLGKYDHNMAGVNNDPRTRMEKTNDVLNVQYLTKIKIFVWLCSSVYCLVWWINYK